MGSLGAGGLCPMISNYSLGAESLCPMISNCSLGAGSRCPLYVSTQLRTGSKYPMIWERSIKSCPVDRLRQYLNSDCYHPRHFTLIDFKFTSVQLIIAWLNSKQLPVSLSTASTVIATLEIRILLWSLGITVQNIHWIKVVQVLNCCSIVISFAGCCQLRS